MVARLALDWGKVRIGVAACDNLEILAFPVTTVPVDGNEIAQISELLLQYSSQELIIGKPVNLRGEADLAVAHILTQVEKLRQIIDIPIILVDERMTTALAQKNLRATGKNARKQRDIIDQEAAVAILEYVLNSARMGKSVGEIYAKEDVDVQQNS